MSSVKYNVERRALARRRELQPAPVRLLDDAPRQRQTNTPPRLLRGKAGLEHASAKLTGNARAVVGDAHAHFVIRGAFSRYPNSSSVARESVDRVLDYRLERPLQQHGVTLHHQRALSELERHVDPVGQRRHARLEIPGSTLGNFRDVHGRLLGGTTD